MGKRGDVAACDSFCHAEPLRNQGQLWPELCDGGGGKSAPSQSQRRQDLAGQYGAPVRAGAAQAVLRVDR